MIAEVDVTRPRREDAGAKWENFAWFRTRSLLAGLASTLAGRRSADVAHDLGCSAATAQRAVAEHSRALRDDRAYAALAANIVHRVIRRDFGSPRRLFDLPRHLADRRSRIEDPARGSVTQSAADCGKR